MRPFRQNVTIAIDGGGIKGVMVARALSILEEHLGQAVPAIFHLAAGTSTGSVISAGIAAGLSGADMYALYMALGPAIFPKTLRSQLWPIFRYRYPQGPLKRALPDHLDDLTMGDLWRRSPRIDVVITIFDLLENRTRFVKPYKPDHADWSLVQAVLASSAVPFYFPIVEGRYIDGGVGSYANPVYVAAYELLFLLGWDPVETTLLSLGTGRVPKAQDIHRADRWWAWERLPRILGAFMDSANDQQVHLVDTFFQELDFRRFQVDLHKPIAMDDVTALPVLSAYGEELARLIMNDITDRAMELGAGKGPV